MKILQIFNQYRFRGGEEMWVERIPELLSGIAEVSELRFQSNDWLGSDAPSPFKQIFLIGDNPASRALLRKRVAEFKPDVLLFHNVLPVGSLGLFQEARKLGIKTWCYTHNFRPFSPSGTLWTGTEMNDAALRGNPWPEIFSGAWQGSRIKTAILAWHLYRARSKGLLDCIDHWLAISDFMRDKFIEAGLDPSKITTLRHCWEVKEEPDLIDEGNHYLFLGRLVREKGVIDLMYAWRKVEERLGETCPELVIAGDGPEMESMKHLASSMKHVRFAGFVDGETKKQLIRQCRALLVPSSWLEPLGLAAFEAYEFKRPVIAARSGALTETVMDGVTGWTHEAANPDALAAALIAAEQSGPELRKALGLAGREWLIHNASPEHWRKTFKSIASSI